MSNKTGILINDTSGERHIGCDNVIKNILYLCKKNGIEIIKTFTRQDVNNQHPLLIEKIKETDIIIINGEGSLHDAYGRRWFIGLLDMIPEGKKTVLINAVWHNMGTIKQMNKLSLIAVREKNSYESLLRFPPKNFDIRNIFVVPDVIFYTPKMPKFINVGYGDSVFGNVSSQLDQFGNHFPLQYHKKGNPTYLTEIVKNDIYSYLKWLKSLDLHITGRFHGVCLSAMAGTPFLALASNARKIEGILRDMGCEDLLITSVKEKETKTQRAQELILNAIHYAQTAPDRIEHLFEQIGKIAHEN